MMDNERHLWALAEGMANAYRHSALLFAVLKIGLFDVLREEALSCEELGKILNVSSRRLRAFLDALAYYDVLVREGDRYAVAQDWLPLTDPEREDNLQARFAHNIRNSQSWFFAAEVLLSDRPAFTLSPTTEPNDDARTAFHRSLGTRSLTLMRLILNSLPIPDGARILDLGGGFGDICRPILERDPKANALLFEAPPTAALAKKHHERLGLSDRFSVIAGDFLTDELPSDLDLVIVSNILHIYSESTCLALLDRLRLSLRPKGLLLIHEVTIDPDREGPLGGLHFAINMAINTAEGDAHPPRNMSPDG